MLTIVLEGAPLGGGRFRMRCGQCGMDRICQHQRETHYCGASPQPPKLADALGVSLLDKVRNFTKAAVTHVAAGMPTCSDEEIERRYAICQGCEFFKDGSCGKCGCPVNRDRKFVSKLAWADQSCPVGKWGPVET